MISFLSFFFFKWGSPFQSLVSPFRFEKLVLPSPSFNHRHTNELPLPSQHTVPRRGSIGGSGGDCTGGGHGSFYPLHGGREAALTRLAFFLSAASPPDLFRFLLLHRDRAGLASSAFIRSPEPAHWSPVASRRRVTARAGSSGAGRPDRGGGGGARDQGRSGVGARAAL